MMEIIALPMVLSVCAAVVYCVWAMLKLEERARDERQALEDRLMAICEPIPLSQVMANRTEPLGAVTYVDEEPSTARQTIKSHEVD